MKSLTVTEAAASLGVNRSTLLHQIKNGAIKATKVGPIWVLTEREVERYRTVSLGKRGRAK
jgi:excisionase family DNA binding protein